MGTSPPLLEFGAFRLESLGFLRQPFCLEPFCFEPFALESGLFFLRRYDRLCRRKYLFSLIETYVKSIDKIVHAGRLVRVRGDALGQIFGNVLEAQSSGGHFAKYRRGHGANPAEELQSPTLTKRLPEILSLREIEQLLDQAWPGAVTTTHLETQGDHDLVHGPLAEGPAMKIDHDDRIVSSSMR